MFAHTPTAGPADAASRRASDESASASTGMCERIVNRRADAASSILRTFDLPVIGRYFPGWDDDIRARLAD